MGIIEEGPNEGDWEPILKKTVSKAAVVEIIMAMGSSVQRSGGSKEGAAMYDQIAGKLGPMIGVWEPEVTNRMVEEF